MSPGASPSRPARKPRVSPSAMKQMSCESGLSATASPRCGGLGAHLRLGRVAEREDRPVELLAGEHGQHVRLVLGRGRRCAAAARPAPSRAWWPVTTASKPRATRPVQHRRELDLLVAAQARVRRTAGGVLGDEVVDHVVVEPVGHVPHVERDADHVGGPPGVPGVLQRAAAARARSGRSAGCGPAPGARRSRRARPPPPAPPPRPSRPRPTSPPEPSPRPLRCHRRRAYLDPSSDGVGAGSAGR